MFLSHLSQEEIVLNKSKNGFFFCFYFISQKTELLVVLKGLKLEIKPKTWLKVRGKIREFKLVNVCM